MLDFDQKREERFADLGRQFKILGQVFTVKRGVRPETMTRWEALGDTLAGDAAVVAMDGLICDLLVAEDVSRWHELRDSDSDENIDLVDLEALIPALFELATGRPFDNAVSSGQASENGQIGTPSTGTSDSRPELALTPSTSEAS